MYGKHERKQALAISTGPWWNDGQLTSRRWSGIYYLRSDYFFVLKKIKFFYFFICFKLIFIWCLIILNVKNNVWKIKKNNFDTFPNEKHYYHTFKHPFNCNKNDTTIFKCPYDARIMLLHFCTYDVSSLLTRVISLKS
jgi:hypothetical protein